MPSSTAGRTIWRRYFGLLKGCTCRPSPTSPATRHIGVHAGDVYGHVRMLDGARIEERRHEIEAEEPAFEIELRPVLPRAPDRAHGQDDLAHLGGRRLELHREAALVVPLDLRAQAQDEPPARCLREVP